MSYFKTTLFTLIFLLSAAISRGADSSYEFEYLYRDLPFSMDKITRPAIPTNEVSIEDFGGKGDGVTLNTAAFKSAIEALKAKGGGRLIVPQGVWYTGPITLLSNIELHIYQSAIIVFSTNMDDYPLINTFFEGLETRRCISPINADGAVNIAITGLGIIDGSGDAWRPVKRGKMTSSQWSELTKSGGILNTSKDVWFPSEGSMKGNDISDMNVPRNITNDAEWTEIKDFLRPVMVSLKNCENILLEGVTFQNSPSWNIHPLICKNLIVNRVNIRNPWYSQNGDGLDIESCTNVIVTNSTLDVGDDAICIKSGKDEDGRKRNIPSSNIIVDNCTVFHGHGGFVVGSEMSGGVKNISVTNCQFIGTDVGLRFKSNRGRGGVVENIYISNISMIDIPTEPLLFDLFYGGKSASESLEDGDEPTAASSLMPVDETTPQFKNIYIKDVVCRGARRAMFFNGLPEMNVSNINIENCTIYSKIGAEINQSSGVTMRNVAIYPTQGAALTINNVKNMTITDFKTSDTVKEPVNIGGKSNQNIKINNKRLIK